MVIADGKLIKAVIIVGVILYVVSPIDLFPGPVDDVVIVLLGAAYNSRVRAKDA